MCAVQFKWTLGDVVDTVRNYDRSIHLSTSLISNLVNQKVAPASVLTIGGLCTWVASVKGALAAEAASAAARASAAAGVADEADDEDMPQQAQSVRVSSRPRVPNRRRPVAEAGAGAGSAGLGLH